MLMPRRYPLSLSLFLFVSSSAWAVVCNPTDHSGCPPTCATGTSFTAIAGTSYGAAPSGVQQACGVAFGSGANLVDIYMPVGGGTMANSPILPCWHGGGFSSGGRIGCEVGVFNYIEYVQRYGIVYITVDYTLSGTSIFPAQVQSAKCFLSTLATNSPSSTWPGNPHDIRQFGTSAGATLALWALWVPDSTFALSGCNVTLNSNYTITATVALSAPIDFCGPGYPAGDSTYTTAINALLNVSSQGTCVTADNSLQASPLKYVTQSNYARLTSPVLFQIGAGDTTVVNPDHAQEAISAAAGLSPPLTWQLSSLCCGHQSDRGSAFAGTQQVDAINWLMAGVHQTGGNAH